MTEPEDEGPRIEELPDSNILLIDGVRVVGFLSGPGECGHRRVYSERYDAYFCPAEDKWLEAGCSDPMCGYCSIRPERPMQGPLDES